MYPSMKGTTVTRCLPFYLLAAAILAVAVVAFGLPVWTLWLLGLVVLCPLMMIFMMGGMHGEGHDRTGSPGAEAAVPGTSVPEDGTDRAAVR